MLLCRCSACRLPLSLRGTLSMIPPEAVVASNPEELKRWRGRIIAAVGDYTITVLAKLNSFPRLLIYDCRTMRRRRTCPSLPSFYLKLHVNNPRSTITREAEAVVKKALRGGYTALEVGGEEDLLSLPAIFHAPLLSIVAYGYPGKGTLLVRVTPSVKKIVERMVGMFECDSEEP
ncbi:MAG: hypothetical protein DSY37_00270 [Hyperthermus sp.]|nr:MAG: hypothetical protein DSY37_00270 [Hyperthermus sp.]